MLARQKIAQPDAKLDNQDLLLKSICHLQFPNVQLSTIERLEKIDPESAFQVRVSLEHLALVEQYLLYNDEQRAAYHVTQFLRILMAATISIGVCMPIEQVRIIEDNGDILFRRIKAQLQLRESILSQTLPEKITFILGMHRSGTSALSGMLCNAGFDPPKDLMGPSIANTKGYWESMALFRLNEDLLASLDTSWRSEKSLPIGWEDSAIAISWREETLKRLEVAFKDSRHAIVKDPRLCLLIGGLSPWFECSEMEFSFLLPLRHPYEVARSLELRENVPCKEGIGLWLRHVFESERASRGHPRCAISFEDLMVEPDKVLTECIAVMNPEKHIVNQDAGDFIENHMRHHQHNEIAREIRDSTASSTTEREIAEQLYEALVTDASSASGLEYIDKLYHHWNLLAHAD